MKNNKKLAQLEGSQFKKKKRIFGVRFKGIKCSGWGHSLVNIMWAKTQVGSCSLTFVRIQQKQFVLQEQLKSWRHPKKQEAIMKYTPKSIIQTQPKSLAVSETVKMQRGLQGAQGKQ